MEDIIREDKRNQLNRPITGIIQNDRVWEQWYDPKVFELELPKMTQKDFLFKRISDDPNRIIINNRGMKKYSVSEFKNMINEYEKAFAVSGLQKGDVICTIGLTTPEMYAIKYAATSLGIITCNLNVLDIGIDDEGKNRLYRQIENVKPKMIFTLDILESKVYPVINNSKFDEIIKISMPLEKSTPVYNPERALLNLKFFRDKLSGKKINKIISLDDFLLLGKSFDFEKVEEVYSEKMPCNISFTSGTTGINKAVLLSHDANNALAFQQIVGDFGFKKGTKNLALVPPFLAFWDADIVHAVLCVGGENIIELSLDSNKIRKYFLKYNINCGIWTQYSWNALLDLPKDKREKALKNLELAIIGGERCNINASETFYKETGVRQITGYGASEVNTTFSITHPYCQKVGTSGIPLPFNNVKIVDDSFRDVTYNVNGRLLITGPCLMNEYYNREDLTKKAIYIDENGVRWYYTGDYAVMDQDGCLKVLDRYSEPVTIKGNNKVNLLDLNEIVMRNRNVKISKINYENNKIILHLVIDDFLGLDKETAINEIIESIKVNIPQEYWPNIINVMDELPRTSVGKVDYKLLKKLSKDISLDEREESFIILGLDKEAKLSLK